MILLNPPNTPLLSISHIMSQKAEERIDDLLTKFKNMNEKSWLYN